MDENEIADYVENLFYDLRQINPVTWLLLDGPGGSSGMITFFENFTVELEIEYEPIMTSKNSFGPDITDIYRIEKDDLEDFLIQKNQTWAIENSHFLYFWAEENGNSWPKLLNWFRDQKVPLRKRIERWH